MKVVVSEEVKSAYKFFCSVATFFTKEKKEHTNKDLLYLYATRDFLQPCGVVSFENGDITFHHVAT